MKRILQLSTFLGIFIISQSASAQMDNLANMSAKWIRSNARNAATDGADIVNYNPAGLVKMNDGVHLSLNNQTLFRNPKHSFTLNPLIGEQTCKQDGADPFLPSLYAAFKKDKWAVSSGIYVTGGGASADYPDGSVNTNLMGYQFIAQTNAAYGTHYAYPADQSIKASSYYLAIPLSFSYSLTDKLSVSLGGRYLIANNHTKANMTLVSTIPAEPSTPVSIDYKNQARGFGGIIGVNYSATENLNIAIHYETKVKLEFEVDDNKGTVKTLFPDGKKSDRDLPAALYTGVSYRISDKFTTALDFNYYFQKNAEWGDTTDPSTGETKETSELAGNCYHVALGMNYQLLPKLQLSAGCKYIHFDYNNQKAYYTQMGAYEAVKYDNFNVGLGAGYSVTENIQIDLGIGRTFWKDKTINRPTSPTTNVPVDIKNSSYVLALGVDLKF